MSKLKLNTTGGSGGSVALKGPASTTSNADVELTLPVDDGTSDQYLKTNGSGVLSWGTVSSTPEGTAVLSTGESGGSKYLREDGDGTCSWQTVSSTDSLSHRNVIINGAMMVDQRNGAYTNTAGEYTLDRWETARGSSFNFDATTTQGEDNGPTKAFNRWLKITPDSTVTPTGGMNGLIRQKIEADQCQAFGFGDANAKDIVISFYAKTSAQNSGHKYSVQLNYSAASGAVYTQTRLFTVTSTWQRFTIAISGQNSTISGDANNRLTYGSGVGMELRFILSSGPDDIAAAITNWETNSSAYKAVTDQDNFMDHTSNEFYLTGVQLEPVPVGTTTATDFEHRSYGDELQRCLRYFFMVNDQRSGGISAGAGDVMGIGYYESSSVAIAFIHFPVRMRTAPSLDAYSATNAYNFQCPSRDDCDELLISGNSVWGSGLANTSDVGGTAGACGTLRSQSPALEDVQWVAFKAEL